MTTLVELRCRHCGTILLRTDAKDGRIEAKCPNRRCRTLQTFRLPQPYTRIDNPE